MFQQNISWYELLNNYRMQFINQLQSDTFMQDRDRLQSQLQSLQELEGELQTTLTATANEKERHFRDKLELHQKLQALALQLDSLRKVKCRQLKDKQSVI